MGSDWGKSIANDERGLAVIQDNWEDENNVKDSWDAEEEELKPTPLPPTTNKPKPTPKAKPVVPVEFIPTNETEQEKKARLERLSRERDLDNAMSLFGLSSQNPTATGEEESKPITRQRVEACPFESLNPTSIPDFDQFTRIITKRFEAFEGSKHYPQFLEGLVSALMSKRDTPEIRKVSGILNDMASLKLREKQAANSKAKPAPSLKGAKKGGNRFDDYEAFSDEDCFEE